MPRPYFQASIKSLEALFEQHADETGILAALLPAAQHLDRGRLKDALHQMVTMSPLQSYTLEVIPSSDEVAVIGAGVVGLQAMESGK